MATNGKKIRQKNKSYSPPAVFLWSLPNPTARTNGQKLVKTKNMVGIQLNLTFITKATEILKQILKAKIKFVHQSRKLS